MPKRATGEVIATKLSDGATSIRGRFRHQGERYRVVFGRDDEGWTRERGRRELDDIQAQLRAGIPVADIVARYEPEPTRQVVDASGPTFHQYASAWLERKRTGEIGDAPLTPSSYDDYLWRLSKHLLPFFARMPVAAITDTDCRRFRAKLFADRDELMRIIEAGGEPTHANGQPRRPLSQRSIQMLLAANFDVPFVQRQVGHADSKLTMNVYAQLVDRSKRAHGAASTRSSRPPRAPSTAPETRLLGH